MRSVVYLIIALICFYYLMDDFIGKNKITTWVTKFVGDFGGTAVPPTTSPATSPAAEPAPAGTKPATSPSQNLSPNPQPLIPIPKKTTQPAPKTKSGTAGGFSLNDLVPHFTYNDLFNPFSENNLPHLYLPAAVAGGSLAMPNFLKNAFGG